MERMAQGPNLCDELTSAVQLVSLGCYCGPKLSFQKMGRGSETLPFDWMRTKLDGLLHFIRNDFSGFYDFVTAQPVPGSDAMMMYRHSLHSFWHDNPTETSMVERYTRRIARFQGIDAISKPVLFVRVASETTELGRVGELLGELMQRFGPQAQLLLVLNFQETVQGPGLIAGMDNLLVYYLSSRAHSMGNPSFGKPYVEPVLKALDWVVGRQVQATCFPSLQAACHATDFSDWGKTGLGGLEAFEDGKAG